MQEIRPDAIDAADEEPEKRFEVALPARLATALGMMPPEPREALMNIILEGLGQKRLDGSSDQQFIEAEARRAIRHWRVSRRRISERLGGGKPEANKRKAARRARRG